MSLPATNTAPLQVAGEIRSLLGAVRLRVRGYLLMLGLAVLLVWLGATFVLGWLLDYGPVLLGSGEMPRPARLVWLVIMAIGTLYLIYRQWLRTLFVPLPDRSLALLVERRCSELKESLVTSIELAGRTPESPLAADMLAVSHRQAVGTLPRIRLQGLFNFAPLQRYGGIAVFLIAGLAMAAHHHGAAFELAARRLYLLEETPWPRFAHIEIVGVESRRPSHETAGIPAQSLLFENRVVKVARGSQLSLRVRADAAAAVIPRQCVLNYRTDDGDSGSVTLKTLGRVQDGYQMYVCDTRPLAGIVSSLDFDILGYDHRLSGYRLETVDSPAISAANMHVAYPDYMVDSERALYLPRENEPVAGNNALPSGTQVKLQFEASKPLQRVQLRVVDPLAASPDLTVIETKELTWSAAAKTTLFEFPLGSLLQNRTIEALLLDADGVYAERWFRVFFTAVPDQPPRWELALRGIGSEVTPDVLLPLAGRSTDDYGLARSWLDLKINSQSHERNVTLAAGGQLETALDFRRFRSDDSALEIRAGDKLTLLARSQDRCNLADQPNTGASEQFVLDVVTPEKLLAGLEAREIALRRRLEQIVDELEEMRDTLLRVRPGEIPPSTESEPSDEKTAQPSPEQWQQRQKELRLLRVQRAIQQVRKSQPEVAGVADSFDLIREELINNRVDTQDRKSRLRELIADPLHAIAEKDFAELEKSLLALEPLLEDSARGLPQAEQTVTLGNELIANLEQILQKMLKLESYNEILDLVRGILRDQQSLREETRREQKRELEE